jgi:hypothetical protein
MIVNSQGAQTPYAQIGKISPLFTGLKFPGGTQAMKTYPTLAVVPEELVEIKDKQGGNPYFISDHSKYEEVQNFAELNDLDVHFGVNCQMTIGLQLVSIIEATTLIKNTKYLLLGSELYLGKWIEGVPNSSGVSRQILSADYLLYLEKIIPVLRDQFPDQNITICGASWAQDSDGNPLNPNRDKARKEWNETLYFWMELNGYLEADWLFSDFHLYIGQQIVDDDFAEEEVFQEVQTHFFEDLPRSYCTEMGTYIEGPHPQNIELYNRVLEALNNDPTRFGIHVLFYPTANGYAKKFDRYYSRHWFALYDPLGIAPKLEELEQWYEIKFPPTVDPGSDVVVLGSYRVEDKVINRGNRNIEVVCVRWFWSDGTVWFSSTIKRFSSLLTIPTDEDLGKPISHFK